MIDLRWVDSKEDRDRIRKQYHDGFYFTHGAPGRSNATSIAIEAFDALDRKDERIVELEIQIINLRHCVKGVHEMNDDSSACRHCLKVLK